MNILGMCAVYCLMFINTVVVCDAECDEYIVVFKETTCPNHVELTPLKERDIHWDKVTYPCNSTDKNSEKKKCVVEFDCLGVGSCLSHNKKGNHQTHSFMNNTNEALVVPKINITVEEKPHHIDEEFNTSKYDVNLIYIEDNAIQNSSKATCENCKLYCDYAETVCIDGGRPENYSLSDVKIVTYNIHPTKLSGKLEIAINRDKTSPVQPLFTGYFSKSYNDSSTNYNNHLKSLKTVTLSCLTLKYNNCKQNIKSKSSKQLNVYIKTNYIENNTITKYPDCTKNSITSENVLNLKCEDILFAKHNPHIVQTPSNPPKQELSTWNCQITELNTLSSKEQLSENSKIHFINCSSETKIGNASPIFDSTTINIYNISTKNGIKMKKTEISTGKEEINIDSSSQTNPENIVTILITEKANNCSDNSYFNINEGTIIDLGINNKEKILPNNHVELILSNCPNIFSSTIKESQPHLKIELNIILKNKCLNTSNLKHFNGTPENVSVKRRILLRCDHPNLDLSSNKTLLECESIDLNLYNITGIEITPLRQTSNNKTAIASNKKTKQEMSNWNCQIVELNHTLSSKEQHSEKRKLFFKNCANDVNFKNSKNKYRDNNATPMFDDNNRTIDSTKAGIKIIKAEMSSEEIGPKKDNLSYTKTENMIRIAVKEKYNNCSNNSSLKIDEGKIIDLRANSNKKKFLQNYVVELKLSSCSDVHSSKVELTIILKSESLNDSNLKQFNGTENEETVKQRILLRCDHPIFDSNNTVLQCESIDLDLFNITGIEISTNASTTSKLNANNTKEKSKENQKMVEDNHNQTKLNAEVNKNHNFRANKTVEKNETTTNNKSNEEKTKVGRNKEVHKKISERKEMSKTLIFNRKKDIPNGAGQNSIALGNPETENILLITLLTIASVAILIVITLKACPKRREYNPAPTREPPDEEETAF